MTIRIYGAAVAALLIGTATVHAATYSVSQAGKKFDTKEITIKAMGADRDLLPDGISSVELLGSPENVDWRRDAESLHLGFPEKVAGKYAFVWKITPN